MLQIIRGPAVPSSAMVTIERRLYVTADRSRAVEEGDPEAAFLLVPAGGELPLEVATGYGLIATEAPAEAVEAPARSTRRGK